ncbi:conjugal transfer protein TraG N-terminal domain-containing protein [Mannheimia haemolytica]
MRGGISERHRSVAGVGGSVGNAITAPAFDSVKQSLPYIQSLMLFAISICMPIIIVFSGYSIKAMMTVTFSWFAVFFLSFWWEIAFWLDTSLYETLYGFVSDKAQLLKIDNAGEFLTETGGTGQEYLLNIITNVMYLVLPGLWVAFLGWAGLKAGAGIDKSITDSGTTAQSNTQTGQDKVTNKTGI